MVNAFPSDRVSDLPPGDDLLRDFTRASQADYAHCCSGLHFAGLGLLQRIQETGEPKAVIYR